MSDEPTSHFAFETVEDAVARMTHETTALATFRAHAEAAGNDERRRRYGRLAAELLYGRVVVGGAPRFSESMTRELERAVAFVPDGPTPFSHEIVKLRAYAHFLFLHRLYMETHPWLEVTFQVQDASK